MKNERTANEALALSVEARAAHDRALASFARPAPVRIARRGWFRRLLGV